MTIGDANRLVAALVGEDDFHDVKDVLSSYYDLAQREIATTVSPIYKSCFMPVREVVTLPRDLYRLRAVAGEYERRDRTHIYINADGNGEGMVRVDYLAYPERLYDDSPTDTEFEVSPDAQSAIPYYAAAQVVLSDSDMRRYYAFTDAYNSILANVAASRNANSMLYVVRTEEMK